MEQEFKIGDLKDSMIQLKDLEERRYSHFVENFYVLRSALRYYTVKKGVSFTSSKMAEDFPMAVTVAGSCLKILSELEVVEPRTRSSSPDRFTPEKVDMEKMKEIGDVLRENHEIKSFDTGSR